MIKLFVFSVLIFSGFENFLFSQEQSVFARWDKTDQMIRDRKIDEDDARDSIALYVKLAVKEFNSKNIQGTARQNWVFPMSGWTALTYRADGKDYKDEAFDYFQGGEFKGHPAHDIFILDKDSNGIEDSTGEKVFADAMVTGIVLSKYSEWFKGDYFRSGNYVKLFDPVSEGMFYYSHLDSVFVEPGEVVKAGEPIGYVGRTGRKAIKGKTHVHIAYYKIEEGHPVPEDIIKDLYSSEKSLNKKE